jgi:hypothetical protein
MAYPRAKLKAMALRAKNWLAQVLKKSAQDFVSMYKDFTLHV